MYPDELREEYPLCEAEVDAMDMLSGYDPDDITGGIISPGMLANLQAKGMAQVNGLLSPLGWDVLHAYI